MNVPTNQPVKQISKIVTFYTDGTFTEFTPSPYLPTTPSPYPYSAPYTWPNNWPTYPNTILCSTEGKKL